MSDTEFSTPRPEPFTREYIQRTLGFIGLLTIRHAERERALEEYGRCLPAHDDVPSAQELRNAFEYLSSDAFRVSMWPPKQALKQKDNHFLNSIERLMKPYEITLGNAAFFMQAKRNQIITHDFQDATLAESNKYFSTVFDQFYSLLTAIRRHLEKGEVGAGKTPANEALVNVHLVKRGTAEMHLLVLHSTFCAGDFDDLLEAAKERCPERQRELDTAFNAIRDVLKKFGKNTISTADTIATCAQHLSIFDTLEKCTRMDDDAPFDTLHLMAINVLGVVEKHRKENERGK